MTPHPKKKFISLSAGVESTTMCILYGKGATAIWSDTGSEHRVMYERVAKVVRYCYKLHGGDFRFKAVVPHAKYKGRFYRSLEDFAMAMKFMPSHGARYCTPRFKIDPIELFLSTQGPCQLMIGFNADEEPGKDRTGNLELLPNVEYSYPLYEAGVNRKECEEILHLHGMHPQFPFYMRRGGCRMCFYKTEVEYRAMAILDPEEFTEVMLWEEEIQDKKNKFFSILSNRVTMRRIWNDAQSLKNVWTIDQLKETYKQSGPEKTCGAFCRR